MPSPPQQQLSATSHTNRQKQFRNNCATTSPAEGGIGTERKGLGTILFPESNSSCRPRHQQQAAPLPGSGFPPLYRAEHQNLKADGRQFATARVEFRRLRHAAVRFHSCRSTVSKKPALQGKPQVIPDSRRARAGVVIVIAISVAIVIPVWLRRVRRIQNHPITRARTCVSTS